MYTQYFTNMKTVGDDVQYSINELENKCPKLRIIKNHELNNYDNAY